VSCGVMNGACAPAPLVRDWTLIRRLGATDFAAGRDVNVKFTETPARRMGKHTHVRALRVVSRVVFADLGSPDNRARTHHFLKSLLYGFFLSDCEGWRYLDNIDGRSLDDLAFFDRGMLQMPPHLVVDAQAGTALPGLTANFADPIETEIAWEIDLAGRVGDPMERVIPVAALAARDAEAFGFRVRDGMIKHSGESFSTISFYQPTASGDTPGVEVWADLVDLDVVNEPARWGVRSYVTSEAEGSLLYPEATHTFAVVRPFAEDFYDNEAQEGEALVDEYDGISVAVGGRDVLSNRKAAEVTYRDLANVSSEPRSYCGEAAFDFALPVEAGAGASRGYLMLLPPRPRESAPAGRVTYKFEDFSPGSMRVLHSFVLCHDGGRRGDIITRAAKMQSVARYQKRADGAIAAITASEPADPTGNILHAGA
jgi:hypothetical protein